MRRHTWGDGDNAACLVCGVLARAQTASDCPAPAGSGGIERDARARAELEARAIVAAAHGVPLSAVRIVTSEPEIAKRRPGAADPERGGAR